MIDILNKILKKVGISVMEHKDKNENDIKRNGSGYYDPTAYRAIKNVEKHKEDYERFQKLLGAIYRVCELAGFHVEGRITLVDERTGKVWR